jgi:RIO kinase 1
LPRTHIGDFADDHFDSPNCRARATTRKRRRASEWHATADDPDLPASATRSTYQESRGSQGPRPAPQWLVTSPAALDYDRAVIKTGKEADVALVERVDPLSGT